jgi:hypothetical protein
MSVPLHRRSTEDRTDIERQIRDLLAEGQIWEAQELLKSAGDRVPAESNLRKVLGPARVRESDIMDFDRSAEFHWLKTKAENYPGKWVALLGEDLLASSDTLKELLDRLAEIQPERRPLIHHLI